MTQIIFNKVSKIYHKNIKAVNDVCLNIDSGELLVLCGPSGCGKSTVLRMLAGLEDISHGEIIINNKVINQIRQKIEMLLWFSKLCYLSTHDGF